MLVLLIIALLSYSNALIHKLNIVNDDRHLFKIETFGFEKDGVLNITISGFSYVESVLTKSLEKRTELLKVGFLIRKAKTETDARQNVEKFIEQQECILDEKYRHKDDMFIDLSDPKTWKRTSYSHVITNTQQGLYSIMFARCHSINSQSSSNYITAVSFRLQASLFNPGPNYLSAGDVPLPTVYMCYFILFTLCTCVWGYTLTQPADTHGVVHSLHYMMLLLIGIVRICMCSSIISKLCIYYAHVGIKSLTLFFESVRYHYISISGSSELWSIIYYIFSTFKGVMLFLVLLLIGSGWSLMKGYLHEKEKRIIFVVLCMQVSELFFLLYYVCKCVS